MTSSTKTIIIPPERVRYLMAECHYELGQYFEAEGFFRQVAGTHPDIKLPRFVGLNYTFK